jgi:hypothetical protein
VVCVARRASICWHSGELPCWQLVPMSCTTPVPGSEGRGVAHLRPTEQIVFPKSAALSVSPGHSRGASLPHPLPVCVNGPLWGSTDGPRTVTVTAPGSCPSQRRVTHRPSLVASALLPTGSDTSCTELPPLLRGSGDSGPAPSAAGDLPLPPSAGGAAEPPPPDAGPPPPPADDWEPAPWAGAKDAEVPCVDGRAPWPGPAEPDVEPLPPQPAMTRNNAATRTLRRAVRSQLIVTSRPMGTSPGQLAIPLHC